MVGGCNISQFIPFQQMEAKQSWPGLWFLLLVHSCPVPSLWAKTQCQGVALEMPHQVPGSPTHLERGSDWGWVDWGLEPHPELWRSQSTFPWLCFIPLTVLQLHSASSINTHAARYIHFSPILQSLRKIQGYGAIYTTCSENVINLF